ncbi:MAG: sigma-54-dependent Fis family transcriptional regulator [Deltaproteobacteria bacterium]|nr:sigma-54-dependent Fis family transcriptional regulator [Deltaproteobacteria bacterium]MCB9786732.1 sigma-54-dependent Fis family transcriptional regulator [Deltaproteobacteria bacterium]
MSSATILVVDDEKNIRSSLSRSLEIEGYRCVTADSVAGALEAVRGEAPDLVMLDVKLPDGDGLDVLRWMKREHAEIPVIVMSGHGTIEMALEAIRAGAHDFVEKPLSTEKMLITIGNAVRFEGQRRELRDLREELRESSELLGRAPAMARLRETIALAAPSQGRVLITGESGTGKELVARAIHTGSRRSQAPFVKLNCAAIPAELIESELFGHERGAFTGAHQARKGKFELAHKGTLFLDEIGDMRMDVQAKLLRALQEGEIERVGGSRTIAVDVRVVAATNQDLPERIADGAFREDLYYRLAVVPIRVPPLRARREDIPLLAETFVARASTDNATGARRLTADALEALAAFDWPGNVRELRNACERLVILTPQEVIDGARVRLLLGDARPVSGGLWRAGVPMRELLADAEREIITAALDAHGGHMTQTAESLGLERSHLYKKVRALDIKREGD